MNILYFAIGFTFLIIGILLATQKGGVSIDKTSQKELSPETKPETSLNEPASPEMSDLVNMINSLAEDNADIDGRRKKSELRRMKRNAQRKHN